ncbi:threonine-phosphate decarboxylase CobD [Desulfothermobacter acidiphilus]|uniref:threonine-phosphate decarboxylase CobD n=1 Tax=Desulfothermobacter acidiphilus TaxID=1938353 RepID=UPI003F89F6DB
MADRQGWLVEHGGNVIAAAATYGGCPEDYLDFSSNINPLGYPPRVGEKLLAWKEMLSSYPDPEARELCRGVAEYLGVEPSCLLPGNGTAELLYWLAVVFSWRRVAVVEPTFSEYARAVQFQGGQVERVCLSAPAFTPRAEELWRLLPGLEAIFLCHPNNPTGQTWLPEDLALLLETAEKHGTFVVVDEAFIDFLPPERIRELSVRKYLPGCRRLLLLYSMTKFFGLAGLRLGFLLAAPEILDRLRRRLPPWRVNVLAQLAGLEAVQDSDFRRQSRELVERERHWLAEQLARLPGFEVLLGQANFLLLRVERTGRTAAEWTASLAQRRLLVRNASNFFGLDPYYIRVAVKRRVDNQKLIATCWEVAKEYGL